MSEQYKYVILGAGQLGLAIMDELVGQGETAKLVNRSGKVNEVLPEGVVLETADLNDPAQVAAVCEGAEIVFFCAQPPYDKWPELFPALAASVIEGVALSGAKLVFGSNVYMYGPNNGRPIHEDLPYAAQTRKGKARAEVAKMLLDAHAQGRLQVVIGRAADFYGPRVTDSLVGEMLFGAALSGDTGMLVGNIDLPHTLTYIGDFARELVTLSRHDEAFGRAWHVPSAETITPRRFKEIIEAEIGRPVKVRVVGKTMMRLAGLFNPIARETAEIMYEFDEPFIIDHSRYVAAFGNGVTLHEEAVRETVAWYRLHHQA
ncbi:MAG: NAD-dependent epimerase/dehydratase family protein [Candidatus Promineifilaceae bacterium]|jgi:nucleoside-diphosphate-sugar epimerase